MEETRVNPEQTTVSVVIITYARPDYIAECIRHLRALETAPHQIIAVDGGVMAN